MTPDKLLISMPALITFAKTTSPNKVLFTESGVRIWAYLLGNHHSMHFRGESEGVLG
jgi:hypothetical protein